MGRCDRTETIEGKMCNLFFILSQKLDFKVNVLPASGLFDSVYLSSTLFEYMRLM